MFGSWGSDNVVSNVSKNLGLVTEIAAKDSRCQQENWPVKCSQQRRDGQLLINLSRLHVRRASTNAHSTNAQTVACLIFTVSSHIKAQDFCSRVYQQFKCTGKEICFSPSEKICFSPSEKYPLCLLLEGKVEINHAEAGKGG